MSTYTRALMLVGLLATGLLTVAGGALYGYYWMLTAPARRDATPPTIDTRNMPSVSAGYLSTVFSENAAHGERLYANGVLMQGTLDRVFLRGDTPVLDFQTPVESPIRAEIVVGAASALSPGDLVTVACRRVTADLYGATLAGCHLR